MVEFEKAGERQFTVVTAEGDNETSQKIEKSVNLN